MFYIVANRGAESYIVSVDNDATDDYDEIRWFETEKEVEEWTESPEAKEWRFCTFKVLKQA